MIATVEPFPIFGPVEQVIVRFRPARQNGAVSAANGRISDKVFSTAPAQDMRLALAEFDRPEWMATATFSCRCSRGYLQHPDLVDAMYAWLTRQPRTNTRPRVVRLGEW